MDTQKDQPSSEILSGQELRRYSAQIELPLIGIEGQEKIKRARVLVIGAGGKGSSVLQHLSSVGVGKIGISDNFLIQDTDLSRQHLYGNGDLGKQKAIAARQKLVQINHFVDFQLHNVCLSEQNIDSICEPYDMLIDATDNFTAHFMINDSALRLNKPFIFGNVDNSIGYVSVFNYRGGPSFRCAYPRQGNNEYSNNDKKIFSCRVTTINIIGSIMANEAIKVILTLDTVLNGNMLIFNAGNYSFSFVKVDRDETNFNQV
jgi:molybdopterin/thiamine biosynthesis adenylyltransferase